MPNKTNKKADEVGPSLLPIEKARQESVVYQSYLKQFAVAVLMIGPIIAYSIYFVTIFLLSEESSELVKHKINFIRQYELHYLYCAVFMIGVIRLPLTANLNGARAPTRLDRPDQHIYQVVGSKDLVLMANDGVNGRFNRAQRAINNMDEALPLFLVNTLLVASIFGQAVCFFLLPLYGYGRIIFARDYKENPKLRLKGFLFSVLAELAMSSLVGLIALKATFDL